MIERLVDKVSFDGKNLFVECSGGVEFDVSDAKRTYVKGDVIVKYYAHRKEITIWGNPVAYVKYKDKKGVIAYTLKDSNVNEFHTHEFNFRRFRNLFGVVEKTQKAKIAKMLKAKIKHNKRRKRHAGIRQYSRRRYIINTLKKVRYE